MKALSKTFLIALSFSFFLFSCKKASSDEPAPSRQEVTNWTTVNFPTDDSLADVFATDANTLYACGAYGHFYKSTNAGQDWDLINASNGGWMSGIWFTDLNTGHMTGGNSIPPYTWKTTDAGATWQGQGLPSSDHTKYTSYGVHFPSASIGYEVSEGGETFKTTDGGENWTLNTTGSSQPFYSVFFTSNTTGYIGGGNNTLMKTTDGGTTWNALTTGLSANADSYIQAIYFLDANTGYLTGGNNAPFRNQHGSAPSFILKTTDGGATWTSLANTVAGDNLSDIYFTDANTGYCIGGNAANYTSTILKTTDAGTTWTLQSSPGHSLSKMCEIDGVLYCVGGIGTVLKGN